MRSALPTVILYNGQQDFNLAAKVTVGGEITFAGLSAGVGMDNGALSRILRLRIAFSVFREPRPGVVAHSAAPRQIAGDMNIADRASANVATFVGRGYLLLL
ncbi:O-methyltransferase [Seiridium cupressi]